MSENKPRLRLLSHTGDRVALIVMILLLVVTLLINLLNALGLTLVEGALYIFLPLVLALVALGWGSSLIVRRITRPTLRRVVAVVLVLALLGLAGIGMQIAAIASGMNYPMVYAVMTAPDNIHRLIVMRGLDIDEQRAYARRDARLAADPDSDPEVTIDDWGYIYTAYALGPLDLFYKPKTLIEGRVRIGYASKGELMLEWEKDNTEGHFFIKNPDLLDEGEMRASAV